MAIRTPDILPGEKGYVSRKDKTKKRKISEKKAKKILQKKERTIGKIKPGRFRIGKPMTTPRKEKKYPIWRFSKKIGEIIVKNKDKKDEKISLKFFRLGGVGNYKHLIQDSDFQMQWAIREQELIITQDKCYVCNKKLSKSASPNLYHYKMWKYRSELLEKASEIPQKVLDGKMTIENAWKKFNNTLEDGNRYYMSLKDTALICATCAKQKGVSY